MNYTVQLTPSDSELESIENQHEIGVNLDLNRTKNIGLMLNVVQSISDTEQ